MSLRPTRRTFRAGRAWRIGGFVVTGLLAVACGGPVLPSVLGSPSVPAGPSVAPSSLSAREIAEARRLREDFGLRSDDAWIRQVAMDPAAGAGTAKYGVPLMPDELAELDRRTAEVESIKRIVVDYGNAHPDEWAGAWIDQPSGGLLIAQFSGHVEQHRTAPSVRINPLANFEVRSVAWPLGALQDAAATLRHDDPWFGTIPAFVKGSGVSIPLNRIKVEVSTANPNAASMIEDRFGWHGMVVVESDGTGALLLRRGRLVLVARDANGAPVPGLACIAVADMPGSYETPIDVPRTDARGTCALDLPATGYWIQLMDEANESLVGLARAAVVADQTSQVTVPVQGP